MGGHLNHLDDFWASTLRTTTIFDYNPIHARLKTSFGASLAGFVGLFRSGPTWRQFQRAWEIAH